MRRLTLILMTVTLFAMPHIARGQALLVLIFGDKLSTDTFQMGINVSISTSNLSGVDGTSFYFSWAFGGFGEIRLSDHWSLQPELTIKSAAGAGDMPGLIPDDPDLDDIFTDMSVTRKLGYMLLPVYVKYRIGPVRIGIGPQVGLLIRARDIFNGTTAGGGEFTLEKDVKGDIKRFDAGVTVGMEYYVSPKRNMQSMRLALKYYAGLTDILKDNSGDAVRNHVFMLTFGIPVGADKEKGTK